MTTTASSRPPNAGNPQAAIANTRQAFVNLRFGPGTQHRIIGQLRNFTLCAVFPATRTPDGWLWVEQPTGAGWVSTSVVTFESVAARPPTTPQNSTPYDNKVAVWHWRGDSVQENTIEELARNLRQRAPSVGAVWVKASDYTPTAGAQWMGFWDTKRNLAIDGPSSIDRWATTLAQFNLDLHLWVVPRGKDIAGETNLIIQAAQRTGVRSIILDVEPYEGFWSGGQAAIRPFMTRIRRALPGNFHIGLCIDPRAQHFNTVFPREWAPFVNSVHPMVYWRTMRRQPDELLTETYQVWGGYGKPIIPALQGDADPNDMNTAITLSVNRHGARGLSWWRLGVIGPVELSALNQPITAGATPPPTRPTVVYGDEQIIRPGETGFTAFSHIGPNPLLEYQGTWGWRVFYKATEAQASRVVVRWTPTLRASGQHDVEVFIPARRATTRNARYKLHGVRGMSGEITVTVDQSMYHNQWVSLGVFDLDRNAPNAGSVFLNDLTGETGREIAFDAVRWRRVIPLESGGGGTVPAGFADGFDSPVGSEQERSSAAVWPGQWYDASPFGRLYFVGTPQEAYHTGADLNLPGDRDANTPVFACASGIVTFANRLPTWGNVLIIKHDPIVNSGLVLYSRYGHIGRMDVEVGARVTRGQPVGIVGNAFGRWAYHLHFDLSPTTILESNPQHWPGRNREATFRNYIDPREFILNNRPRR
jgi:murein DD-endopeptidase MepM/ murein hydrolase activator NlpD